MKRSAEKAGIKTTTIPLRCCRIALQKVSAQLYSFTFMLAIHDRTKFINLKQRSSKKAYSDKADSRSSTLYSHLQYKSHKTQQAEYNMVETVGLLRQKEVSQNSIKHY